MSHDRLNLDNQLCFATYAASRLITKQYRPLLKKIGLTYPQYLVMLVLWEKDNVTVKALGERLYLDSGTLTPLLKRLEKNELIERNRSSADERKVFVSLTAEGVFLRTKASDIPKVILDRDDIEEDEFNRLRDDIKGFNERLKG